MNPDGIPPTEDREPARTEERKSVSPLILTPEQARREARKLHQLRQDLEKRRVEEGTTMRSSPLGRDD